MKSLEEARGDGKKEKSEFPNFQIFGFKKLAKGFSFFVICCIVCDGCALCLEGS